MKTKGMMILIPAVFAAFAAAAWLGEVSVDLAFDPPVVAQEADYITECGRSAFYYHAQTLYNGGHQKVTLAEF